MFVPRATKPARVTLKGLDEQQVPEVDVSRRHQFREILEEVWLVSQLCMARLLRRVRDEVRSPRSSMPTDAFLEIIDVFHDGSSRQPSRSGPQSLAGGVKAATFALGRGSAWNAWARLQ